MSYFNPMDDLVPNENKHEIDNEINSIYEYIDETWIPVFEKCRDELEVALYRLSSYDESLYYPSKKEIFACFRYTSYDDLNVVIVGQDPYPGVDKNPVKKKSYACGLAFSSHKGQDIPYSLSIIFAEISKLYGKVLKPEDGSLYGWAKQGVLLLNSSLTVIKNKPGSMNSGKDAIWYQFISHIIKIIGDDNKKSVPFLSFGIPAQNLINFSTSGIHLIKEMHPAGQESIKGTQCFKEINNILLANKKQEIDWYNTIYPE